MPSLTPELDQNLAYVFCPHCRQQGTPNTPLTRDGTGAIKCQFGHGPFDGNSLVATGAEMVKSSTLYTEQPTITDVKWPIWVNPEIKTKLERKFAGRHMVTIATFLAALSDDSIVLITGEQAMELRKLGVKNGAEMLAVVKSAKETESQLQDANKTIERFMTMVHAAGVPGA